MIIDRVLQAYETAVAADVYSTVAFELIGLSTTRWLVFKLYTHHSAPDDPQYVPYTDTSVYANEAARLASLTLACMQGSDLHGYIFVGAHEVVDSFSGAAVKLASDLYRNLMGLAAAYAANRHS